MFYYIRDGRKFPYCIWDIIENTYYWFKHKWKEITTGVADCDTWDLGLTSAHFILPRLIRYKKLTNGYPAHLTEEIWDKYLNEMIWSFSYIVGKTKENQQLDDELMLLFPKDCEMKIEKGLLVDTGIRENIITFKEYQKFENECEERCNLGLEIFGKYFQHLWW